jgi:FkbM family methyltransferase
VHSVTLPNGIDIVEINPHETSFLYDEIFIQELYGSRGIEIAPGGVVIDVGANIGLFALYMAQKFNVGRMFCFEPAPHCFEALKTNVAPLGTSVVVSNAALGDGEGQAEFTYYPNYTIMSSMVADKQRDGDVLRAGARTQLERKFNKAADERMVEYLVGRKLDDAQTFQCPVTTLSQTFATHGINRAALVKIDVECAETIVLNGIADADWARIDQFVIEVHDQGAQEHEAMRDRLVAKGYNVQLLAESNLVNSGIFEIIARR